MQFWVIVVTDPQTNTPTNRQDRLQYTAPQFGAQCNKQKFHNSLGKSVPECWTILDCAAARYDGAGIVTNGTQMCAKLQSTYHTNTQF